LHLCEGRLSLRRAHRASSRWTIAVVVERAPTPGTPVWSEPTPGGRALAAFDDRSAVIRRTVTDAPGRGVWPGRVRPHLARWQRSALPSTETRRLRPAGPRASTWRAGWRRWATLLRPQAEGERLSFVRSPGLVANPLRRTLLATHGLAHAPDRSGACAGLAALGAGDGDVPRLGALC